MELRFSHFRTTHETPPREREHADGRYKECPVLSCSQEREIARLVRLVLLALLLALALSGLGADLLVVLLEGRKVLTGLGELTLLHTLPDVPVHEGALGVHEIELVVDAREDL